ncbi:hypothetical protein KFE25_007983 [Diacronema lutheri]|uniref:Uncharacterized protein n=1 Tax=Diacronema lutheri TaxID=2081491 RepID=A0A8J5XN30_DIALT|nr:hypothetical protein KFE25_007983 [Diacronema lutheri]
MISAFLLRYEPTLYLAPALIVLAATELYFWHLHGVLCLLLVVAAGVAHTSVARPKRPAEELRGVPVIVRHMGKNLAHADDQIDGVIALLDATRSAAPDRAEALAQVVRERGVHAVCEALVQHPSTSSFVVPAYQLLHRLLLSPEHKGEIINAFNVDSLMGSITTPLRVWLGAHRRVSKEEPPDVTLLAKGFGVLAQLVDAHVAMQDGALELRVPELVVQSLALLARFAAAHDQLAPVGLRCLFHCCFQHAQAKRQFAVDADGLRVLLRTLSLQPRSREVQLHGLGLLYDCLSHTDGADMHGLRIDAVDAGVLTILADARANFPGVQTIVDSATQMEAVLGKLANAVGERAPPDGASAARRRPRIVEDDD